MPTNDEWNEAEHLADELGAHYATPEEGVAAVEKRIAWLTDKFNTTRNESEAKKLGLEIAQAHARLEEYQLQLRGKN